MIYNTGSPALYRKYRLYRKSRLIPEVPPYTGSPALYRKSRPCTGSPAYTGSPAPTPEVPPTSEVPPLYRKSRLHRKSRPYTRSPAHLSINHFDRWCMVITTPISMVSNVYIYIYIYIYIFISCSKCVVLCCIQFHKMHSFCPLLTD